MFGTPAGNPSRPPWTATNAATASATRASSAPRTGVEVEMLFFVPPGENLEIWKTTGPNTSERPRRTSSSSPTRSSAFFEALNDMTNYQRTYSIGEVEVEGTAIYHKTEYRERRDHYTPIRLYPSDRRASTPPGMSSSGSITACTRPRCPSPAPARKSVGLRLEPHRCAPDRPALGPGRGKFAFLLAYVEQGNRPSSTSPS